MDLILNRRNRHGSAVVLTGVVIAMACAGCSGGTNGSSTVPVPSPSASTGANAGQTAAFGALPLDAYVESPSEWSTFEHAEAKLTNQCMARFGFAAVLHPMSADDWAASDMDARNRLFGLTNVAEARANGLLPVSVVRHDVAIDRALSDAEQFVFTGLKPGEDGSKEQTKSPGAVGGLAIPAGGCLGEARQKVYGSPTATQHFTMASDLRDEAWNRAFASPVVTAANAKWAACMTERGYHYKAP